MVACIATVGTVMVAALVGVRCGRHVGHRVCTAGAMNHLCQRAPEGEHQHEQGQQQNARGFHGASA